MGTFVFKWEHPAEEVFVTGTFDNWTKSVRLDKVGDVFEKEVELEPVTDKIYYKFVVDNEWVTNSSAAQELDSTNNVNNVLLPDQIKPKLENVIMSSVGPDATTVALAGAVPLEKRDDAVDATPSDVPGAFPETPADQSVSVNPLPAAIGAVNPVNVKPGDPLPPAIAGDNIHEHVKLDKESYEKADALPGLSDLPAVAGSMIPESSLPIQTAIVSSIHPNATATETAGSVPLDPEVPAVVQTSQAVAGVDPEASAVPEEVREKAVVENELLEKVAPAPSTSEGTAGVGTEKTENSSAIGAAAATIGGAVVASALVAKDSIAAQAGPVVEQIKAAVGVQSGATEEQQIQAVSPEVPTEVRDSIVDAGQSPEAAANTEAVEAKKTVESELLAEAHPAPPPADHAPVLPEVDNVASPLVLPTFDDSKVTEAAPVEPAVVEGEPKPVDVPSTIDEVPSASSTQPPSVPAVAVSQPATSQAADSQPTTSQAALSQSPDEPSQAPTAVGDEEVPKLVETPADARREGSQGSGSEKKKKHRFSAFFGKLKSKFSTAPAEAPRETA